MNNYILFAIFAIAFWMFIGFSGAVKTFKKALDTDVPTETSNSAGLMENMSERNRDTNEKNRKMMDDLRDKMKRKF